MSKCLFCGQSDCGCSGMKKSLSADDMVDVLVYLANVGFEVPLGTRRLFWSLSVESVCIASHREHELIGKYLPCWSSRRLNAILFALLGDELEASAIIDAARELEPEELLRTLLLSNRDFLFGLLALYNRRYRFPNPKQRCPLYTELWRPLTRQVRLMKIVNTPELSVLLLPLVRGTEAQISKFGHSRLSTEQISGRRFCKAVYLGADVPTPVLQLVLCHELVHLALWLWEPQRSVGYTKLEEVVCHAVVDRYTRRLLSRPVAAGGPRAELTRSLMLHTRAGCERAAVTVHESMFKNLLERIDKKRFNATDVVAALDSGTAALLR